MIESENDYYQAEVSYNGVHEAFTFWIIRNSLDIKGDVKSEYRRLRENRGQDWKSKKYRFIDCYPIDK